MCVCVSVCVGWGWVYTMFSFKTDKRWKHARRNDKNVELLELIYTISKIFSKLFHGIWHMLSKNPGCPAIVTLP